METRTNTGLDRQIAETSKHIDGWGIDADPANNPTYPMKNYTGADFQRLNYPRPDLQTPALKILHSNERPNLTAVFGTSVPRRGLSGALRKFAFKFSEGSSGHWLTLILADRVNVVEGIIDDLRHGYIPNIFAERGWKAEWKYNRQGAIRKIVVSAGVASVLITYWVYRRRSKKMRTG